MSSAFSAKVVDLQDYRRARQEKQSFAERMPLAASAGVVMAMPVVCIPVWFVPVPFLPSS